MKMKKIAFVFSMIAMFCVLTACSDGKEELGFKYSDAQIIASTIANADQVKNASDAQVAYWENSDDELADAYITGVQNFQNATTECGEFLGYRSKADGDVLKIDYEEINQMDQDTFNTWYANLIDNIDATITEDGDTVTVNLVAVYTNRNATYSFTYDRNPEYDYAYELYQQQVAPYQIKEIVVTPDYTFGEKMGKAGANTLMGMGTVFAVLIFISLIISQFERLNKLITKIAEVFVNLKAKMFSGKKPKAEEKEQVVAATTTSSVQTASTSNPMDDGALVAVITAAVVAANTANGGTDRLVVRSIKKAKR